MSAGRLADFLERDSRRRANADKAADHDVDARQPPTVLRFSAPRSLLIRRPVIFLILKRLRNEVNAKRIPLRKEPS